MTPEARRVPVALSADTLMLQWALQGKAPTGTGAISSATTPLTLIPGFVVWNTTMTSATVLNVSPHRLIVWAMRGRRNPL